LIKDFIVSLKKIKLITIGWGRMAYGRKVSFDAIREIAFGGIGAAYAAVGTATTDNARLININNSTDAEVYISLDGSTDHLRLPANSFKLFDFSANKIRDDGFFIARGTVFSVKQVSGAPSSGSVWIEVVYGAGGV